MTKTAIEAALADEIGACYADPLRFVMLAFPWGEKGTPLENYSGPVGWQREYLIDLGREIRERKFDGVNAVTPIRMAVASGHGIGKSALVGMLCNFVLSTRPHCQGTVSANTFPQLESKTWAQIRKWAEMSITRHWFNITSTRISHLASPETWFVSAQTCREESSEAFAGQHAANSTSFYILDEASAIPDKIWEVASGGLTDGEGWFLCFGNPTRNSGAFYRACFGSDRDRWNHRSIDSRECVLTNKQQIAEWLADYGGEDSDFVRVRVRGLPPSASELQFIDAARVQAAQKRQVEALDDEPLIAGFDVSGGGKAWNVIRFRRGLDARSIPPVQISGEAGRDRSVLIGVAAEAMRGTHGGRKIAVMFVDSAFGAPVVERLHTLGFDNVIEVNFGGPSPDHHQANQRAYMWARMKDWLLRGAIGDDSKLEIGLCGPGYHINRQNKLVLESKQDMQKRGEASPDDADALALTFAQPVAPQAPPERPDYSLYSGPSGWMA
jgi:hypothetical protein